ncbi:MAG: pilus assembly protein PilP [Methylotenera sp.]|jgi:type IV pilus assembly protein PilP
MRFNLLLLTLLACLLAACDSKQGDDLDQFMANAANNMSKSVAPLPEVLPYTPLEYNVDGALNDPFKPRKVKAGGGSLQPNTNRPREALESFPLESLIYVGSLSNKGNKYALIKTPDETLQRVKVGNYLGPNFGRITSISENEINIKEVVQDDVTGDWIERDASINLQE